MQLLLYLATWRLIVLTLREMTMEIEEQKIIEIHSEQEGKERFKDKDFAVKWHR